MAQPLFLVMSVVLLASAGDHCYPYMLRIRPESLTSIPVPIGNSVTLEGPVAPAFERSTWPEELRDSPRHERTEREREKKSLTAILLGWLAYSQSLDCLLEFEKPKSEKAPPSIVANRNAQFAQWKSAPTSYSSGISKSLDEDGCSQYSQISGANTLQKQC